MQKTTLMVDIQYDPEMTHPEGLATAMDRLLKTALSTPDLLDEYGNPHIGEFFIAKETAVTPATSPPRVVLDLFGGVLQDVFASDPAIAVTLVDWDQQGSSPSEPGIVELPDPRGGTRLAAVMDLPVFSLERLIGTDVEAALKAAGYDAVLSTEPPTEPPMSEIERWVLYDPNNETLVTTNTYGSYQQAVDTVDPRMPDVLVLRLGG
jgi:hypothetical protein